MECNYCVTRINPKDNSGNIYVCSDYCKLMLMKFKKVDINNIDIAPRSCLFCQQNIKLFDYCFFSNDSVYCSKSCSIKKNEERFSYKKNFSSNESNEQ